MKIRSVKKRSAIFSSSNDVNWAEMYFLRKTLKKIITIYFQFQGQKKILKYLTLLNNDPQIKLN